MCSARDLHGGDGAVAARIDVGLGDQFAQTLDDALAITIPQALSL
jgi:hypothetical protein